MTMPSKEATNPPTKKRRVKLTVGKAVVIDRPVVLRLVRSRRGLAIVELVAAAPPSIAHDRPKKS